jgi:hypothetical protein
MNVHSIGRVPGPRTGDSVRVCSRTRMVLAAIFGLVALATGCARPEPPTSDAPAPSASTQALAAPAAVPMGRLDVSPALERSCREICDRSHELRCAHAAQCMPNCMAGASMTPCNEPMATFYRCLVHHPVQNWQCGRDGVAAIREGFCDREQGEAVACMEAKMQ